VSLALALDLGTATTRLANGSGELIYEGPTVAAVETDSRRLVAFGDEALGLGARSGGRVQLRRPVRAGKLLDIDLAESFLAALLRRPGVSRLGGPRMLVCSHLSSTGVQRRAVGRALKRAGARTVSFVEQPVACAIGAGLEISEPVGTMVVDLGAGVCDVAVIALGGLVSSASVEVGGDNFDEAVREHLARRHGLLIDRAAAAQLRRAHATMSPGGGVGEIEVPGRDTRSGALRTATVARAALCAVIDRVAQPIFDTAARCITSAPPDLANDLISNGLILAGGGSRIEGFDRRLAQATGVPVHVPHDSELLAVLGAAQCLEEGREPALSLSSARAR